MLMFTVYGYGFAANRIKMQLLEIDRLKLSHLVSVLPQIVFNNHQFANISFKTDSIWSQIHFSNYYKGAPVLSIIISFIMYS